MLVVFILAASSYIVAAGLFPPIAQAEFPGAIDAFFDTAQQLSCQNH
jgi:hypothetical protein